MNVTVTSNMNQPTTKASRLYKHVGLGLVLSFLFFTNSSAQNARDFTGTEFWLSFTENNFTPAAPFDSFDLVITCERKDTVEVKSFNKNITRKVTVYPGAFNRIRVPIDWTYYNYYVAPVFTPIKIGVQITSKRNIAIQVYNLLSGSNSATSILPKSMLENGQEYILHTWPGRSASQASQAVIVAMDTGITEIEITLANSLHGGPAKGFTLNHNPSLFRNMRLKQGESFMIMAFDTLDLSGTSIKVVKSCKKVAVFNGARCARVQNNSNCGSCDALFEQVFPKSYAAKQFVAGPMIIDSIYQISVVPVSKNTNVKINGISVGNYDPFNPYKQEIKSKKPIWIETDKPAQVMTVNNSSSCNGSGTTKGDPALTYVSSVGKGILKSSFSTQLNPVPTDNYLVVYSSKFNTPSTIRINGNSFSPVGGWKSTELNGNRVWYGHMLLSSNSYYKLTAADTGFWAYMYGYAPNEGYGLCLAANINNNFADFTMSPEKVCSLQTPVQFVANGDSINQIGWDYGDGSTGLGTNTMHTYSKPGTFLVKMINSRAGNFCGADTIKKYITVFPGPSISLDKDTHPCLGNPLRLELPNNLKYSYKWEDGSVGNIHIVFKDKTTTVITTDSNGCEKTDSLKVLFKDCSKTDLRITNVFTPNGDGFNDEWKVYFEGWDIIKVKIINRYGAVVASYSLPEKSDWNGKVNNNLADCAEGMYYYYLEATQNKTGIKKEFKGGLYLIR